ncbi:hypothetical protein [Streptomyces sp. NPDC017520]|uniref:hypothetical protein n=1 Tax=Streptomyces sp. NPDC017520 TaxID=3364998 RepID=UPI00378A247A
MTHVAMLEALNHGLRFFDAAAARLGVQLHLLTFDQPYYAQELRAAPGILCHSMDTSSVDDVAGFLVENGITALISNTDRWAPTAEALAERLGLPAVQRNTGELLDKTSTRQRLHEVGLARSRAVAGTEALALGGEVLDIADRPVIVKDSRGSGSKDVLFATTPQGVVRRIKELESRGVPASRCTVETYATGPMFSAETWTTDERTHLLGVSSRTISPMPNWKELDSTYPIRPGSDWERDVHVWVSSVLEAVGRGPGPSHVEFIDTAHGFELVEVNPRLGGGLGGAGIVEATGVDVYALLIHNALGNSTEKVFTQESGAPAVGGYAQVDKYASRTGPLGSILGEDILAGFPGRPQWHPVRLPDYVVSDLTHQGAAFGTVSAVGDNAETALLHAHAAARHIVPANDWMTDDRD